MQPSRVFGKPRMALKDKQLMAIQHVYTLRMFVWLPTGMAGTHVESYHLYSCLVSTWKGRRGILWACKLHFYVVKLHIAIVYFTEYVLVVICKFSLRMLENVAELLAHA